MNINKKLRIKLFSSNDYDELTSRVNSWLSKNSLNIIDIKYHDTDMNVTILISYYKE